MKKAFLLALCLALGGMLAVNGTFAADFTQAVGEAFSMLFKTVQGLTDPTPEEDRSAFQVSLICPDDATGLPVLTPGSSMAHKVTVKNLSSAKSAYFRIAFAVQDTVRPYLALHFNETGAYTWLDDWRENITIGDHRYDLMIGTYTQELPAGGTAPDALLSVALSDSITSEQMNSIADDFLQIQVLAICADDFPKESYPTAQDALDAALPIASPDFNPFQ